jgi:uncharacterized protein (TIGR03435 family)
MKRNEIRIEEILRVPPNALKEMDQALDRIFDRLRSDADLIDDHLPEEPSAWSRPGKRPTLQRIAVLVAATLLIVVAGLGVAWQRRYGTFETANGVTRLIFSGTILGEGGGVLTLRDGSRVEIRPMSQLSLKGAVDGIRIDLIKGSIIVNAAKQPRGHLYVQTKDMTVAVVGTVFVVQAEESGSRVAVVEGRVQVRQGGTEKQLAAGEGVTTSGSIELSSLREEVSWSRHAQEHLALLAIAQQEVRPEFEIADVHVSPPSEDGRRSVLVEGGESVRGGRYEIYNATIVDLIRTAYSVEADAVLDGPTWLTLDRFDIIAKVPEQATMASVKIMLQSLLSSRFKLVARTDTRPMPAWVLARGAGEHKLKRSVNSGEAVCRLADNNEQLSCRNVSIDAFVRWLRTRPSTTLPVVNSTGIEGAWDFDLRYTFTGGFTGISENNPQNKFIIDAFEKQTGLKLELHNVPQTAVLVESVNRAPTPNPLDIETRLPPDPVEFEVVSIRPCETVDLRAWRSSPSGQLTTGCQPLSMLISRAWNLGSELQGPGNRILTTVPADISGAPSWLKSKRFDIVAKAPVAVAQGGDVKYRAMLRNLLLDRFKMITHYENRPVDVYTLVAVKPKLKTADPSTRAGCKATGLVPGASSAITCQNVTLAEFVDVLNRQISVIAAGRRVIDETGIQGTWDVTLTYRVIPVAAAAPGVAADPAGDLSPFDAIERQLGLKLQEAKRAVPMFVIDHIEENPTEN